MTEPSPTYYSAEIALFQPPTPTVDIEVVIQSLATYYTGRRDGLLRELAAVERELGLGGNDNPTTAQIRAWWRGRMRECPRCGATL